MSRDMDLLRILLEFWYGHDKFYNRIVKGIVLWYEMNIFESEDFWKKDQMLKTWNNNDERVLSHYLKSFKERFIYLYSVQLLL